MRRWVRFSFLILLIGMLGADRVAMAQGRLSDKDLQRLMQNLKDDSQPFRQSFANALKKSTIRKTSREKDARALADTFAKQANNALNTFKHHQKAVTKKELLIFVTPHVVITPTQIAQESHAESSKAELAPRAFNEQELNKFFDTLPIKPIPDKKQ